MEDAGDEAKGSGETAQERTGKRETHVNRNKIIIKSKWPPAAKQTKTKTKTKTRVRVRARARAR